MKKHIVCFGDSNTHGYCADPNDSADRTDRFNEDERWTCLLQKAPFGRGVTAGDGEGKPGKTAPPHSDKQALCQSDAIAESFCLFSASLPSQSRFARHDHADPDHAYSGGGKAE